MIASEQPCFSWKTDMVLGFQALRFTKSRVQIKSPVPLVDFPMGTGSSRRKTLLQPGYLMYSTLALLRISAECATRLRGTAGSHSHLVPFNLKLASSLTWPWVQILIVPLVNIPIPTKIDSNGWCTYPPNWTIGFDPQPHLYQHLVCGHTS